MLLVVEARVAAVLAASIPAAEMQWLAAVRIEAWHWYRAQHSYEVLRRYLSRVPFHTSGTHKLEPVFFNPSQVHRKNVFVQPDGEGWDPRFDGRVVHLTGFVPRPELRDLVCCVCVHMLRSGRCHILVLPLSYQR